jgi:hypothetical protein
MVLGFEQVSEAQDADPVGDAVMVAQARELQVHGGLEQGLFGHLVREAKPLLKAVDAQHGLHGKGRPAGLGGGCVPCNAGHQFCPGHDEFHLVEQHLLARAPCVQVEPKVLLLHVRSD